ncbi:YTH domain-containing family protein isoform X2 [Eurosta solidaginis]|uniref:YTH domain-containing family protein isoform X2 n=1 Tax=Eurosta solidaginis TaxID=178769 RepID=UPI0035312BB8
MSSSVSEQMKVPGPTGSHQSSMQFQYPPFNPKDPKNASWNSQKFKSLNNIDSNKKHAKQTTFGNVKRDEFQSNPWGLQKQGKHINEHPLNNNNRVTRMENFYVMGKSDSKAIMNLVPEEKKMLTTSHSAPQKKTTWASIASQPAKLTSRTNLSTLNHKKKGPGMPPPPMVPGKHNLDVNAWESPNNNPPSIPSPPPSTDKSFTDIHSNYSAVIGSNYDIESQTERTHKKNQHSREENKPSYGRFGTSPVDSSRKNWSIQHPELEDNHSGHIRRSDSSVNTGYQSRRNNYSRPEAAEFVSHVIREPCLEQPSIVDNLTAEASSAVLEKLHDKNNYNPLEIDLDIASSARFFVIKSYSEDDIHRSIKYEIWCSTDHGNKRLDDAFKERQKEGGQILLFFSVNGSGHFCGMAQMMTAVDYNSTSSVWSQDKWKGKFKVKWIYVKDVPNTKLRHIRLENNDNKSVTNSRDTQEVPNPKGIEVLQILHCYKHSTSIFDDFYHYEKKQEEEVSRKPSAYDNLTLPSPISRQHSRQADDRERERDTRGIGGSQKYFTGGSTNLYERKNSYRGSFHNSFNDHRRNESHKMNPIPDSQQKERNGRIDFDAVRDKNDYVSRQKFDYNQRPKQNREHDFCEKDPRFRTLAKEMLRDNENYY